MTYGILGGGQATKKQALAGLRQSANEETKRNIQNEKIKLAEEQADNSTMGMGATMGLIHGLSSAGEVGTFANSVGTALSTIGATPSGMGAIGASAAGSATAGAGGSALGMGATLGAGITTAGLGLLATWALTEIL